MVYQNYYVKYLSVVTAHFNEGIAFHSLLLEWGNKLLESSLEDFEIIIVDDHSDPHNFDELTKFVQTLNFKVNLLRNNINQGAGFSFKRGIAEANANFIVIIDSDGQFAIDDLLSNLYRIQCDYDSIIFERRKKFDSWFYVFGSRLTNAFMNKIFKTNFNDFSSAYKVFSKSVVNHNLIFGKRMNYSVEHTCLLIRFSSQIIKVSVDAMRSNRNSSLTMKVINRGLNRLLFIIYLYFIQLLIKRDEFIS